MTSPSASHPEPDPWEAVAPEGDHVARDFWGDDADWTSTASSAPVRDDGAPSRRGVGGAISRWWNPAATGSVAVTRVHAPATPRDIEAHDDIDDVRDIDDDDEFESFDDHAGHADRAGHTDHTGSDDGWNDIPVAPPRAGVDPLLARLGGLAVVVTLLVPVVMGFRSDHDGVRSADDAPAPAVVNADTTVGSEGSGNAAVGVDPATSAPIVAASALQADGSTAALSTDAPTTDAPTTDVPTTGATTAPAPVVAALSAPACGLSYEIVAGDFWIRIAEGSGTSLDELLAVNEATDSTPLYPGRSICLPVGAERPAPPAAPTTDAPTTTAPATTSASTSTRTTSSRTTSSRKSSTTSPTTTTPAPPPPAAAASPADVEAIIRSVWPDDLEDHAVEIARRESNLRPNVKNSCCYGLFQVYWKVHQSWLRSLGVTSADQLYDPATNARVALALYQRAGSWAPWGG